MKIKKVAMLMAVLLMLSVIASCTQAGSAEERLYIYNWGDYIDMDLITMFEEETGIRVIYETFDSNEAMYARVQPGGTQYDLIFPSDYMIERMINENMLEKIDMGNIPNFVHVYDRFKGLFYDPNDEYSVAYMWGTLGILYNTEMVDEPVDSWSILWNEKYKGLIIMYDSQRDTFTAALKKLGFSVNTRCIEELTLAKNELIRQKPLVQAYLGDQVKDKMIGNEAALAIVYSGDAMYTMEENPALNYVVPREGSNIWYDGMVIPKGARNKANAEKFIDFLCRPEVAAQNTMYIGYSTANRTALDLLPDEMRFSLIYWPSEEILAKCEVFLDLGDFVVEFDRAWTELLAS